MTDLQNDSGPRRCTAEGQHEPRNGSNRMQTCTTDRTASAGRQRPQPPAFPSEGGSHVLQAAEASALYSTVSFQLFASEIEMPGLNSTAHERRLAGDLMRTAMAIADDIGWDDKEHASVLSRPTIAIRHTPHLGLWLRAELANLIHYAEDERARLRRARDCSDDYFRYSFVGADGPDDEPLSVTRAREVEQIKNSVEDCDAAVELWRDLTNGVGEPLSAPHDETLRLARDHYDRQARIADDMRERGMIQHPDGDWFHPSEGRKGPAS